MVVVSTGVGGKEYPVNIEARIHFSGMPTSELDFSGLHINLIYLLCKTDLS